MYVFAWLVFQWFYMIIAFMPMIAVLLIKGFIFNGLPEIVVQLAAGLSLCLFFVMSYRAKLAAGIFVDSSYNWAEAHNTSGAILKAQIALLPIIGRFFRETE